MSYSYEIATFFEEDKKSLVEDIKYFASLQYKNKEIIEEKLDELFKYKDKKIIIFLKNFAQTLFESNIIKTEQKNLEKLVLEYINKMFKYLDSKNYIKIIINYNINELLEKLPEVNYFNLKDYNRLIRNIFNKTEFSDIDYKILNLISDGIKQIFSNKDNIDGHSEIEKYIKRYFEYIRYIFDNKYLLRRLAKVEELEYFVGRSDEFISYIPTIIFYLLINNYEEYYIKNNIKNYVEILYIASKILYKEDDNYMYFMEFIANVFTYYPEYSPVILQKILNINKEDKIKDLLRKVVKKYKNIRPSLLNDSIQFINELKNIIMYIENYSI